MSEYDDVLGFGKAAPEILERSVSLLPVEHGGATSPDGSAVIAHSPSIGVPL